MNLYQQVHLHWYISALVSTYRVCLKVCIFASDALLLYPFEACTWLIRGSIESLWWGLYNWLYCMGLSHF